MSELVRWDEELAKHAKAVASSERPAVSQISTRAGVMMYRGVEIPDNKLQCVIITQGVERRYDTKPFDADNITPPDCFALSVSGSDEEMVPAPESPSKQAESCSSCPQNQWQANPRRPGKNHKPCKERRRLALLPAASVTGSSIKSAEMALLALPVTSVKHWATYVNRLAAEFGRPPWAMITEVYLKRNPQTQFEVRFEPVAPVADEYLSQLMARIEGANGVITTPYDSSGYMVPEDGKDKKNRKY